MLGSNKKLRDLPIHQGVVPDFCFDDQSANKEIPRGKLLAFDSDVEYLLSCNDANALIYKVKRIFLFHWCLHLIFTAWTFALS